jgi:hypothetical protein
MHIAYVLGARPNFVKMARSSPSDHRSAGAGGYRTGAMR